MTTGRPTRLNGVETDMPPPANLSSALNFDRLNPKAKHFMSLLCGPRVPTVTKIGSFVFNTRVLKFGNRRTHGRMDGWVENLMPPPESLT